MTREHKYRAWDIKRKIIIYDGDAYAPQTSTPEISAYPAQPVQVKNDCIIYPYRAKDDGWVCVHDKDGHAEDYYRSWDYDKILTEGFIFEEFTGKRDSKRTAEFPEGQEIYEGDNIRIKSDEYDYDYISAVRWDEELGCLILDYPPGRVFDDAPVGLILDFVEKENGIFEIVGNVHSQKENKTCQT